MDYKKRIDEIRRKIDSMTIEEIAADLETYVGDLEIEISIVDKKYSGICLINDYKKETYK